MANASKSALYERPWKDAIASSKKLPRPGFIAPRATDLHVELLAVPGFHFHMGATSGTRVCSSSPRAGRLCCEHVGQPSLSYLVQCSRSLTARDQLPSCQDQTRFRLNGSATGHYHPIDDGRAALSRLRRTLFMLLRGGLYMFLAKRER